MKKKTVTMKDIASVTGVSITTVSHVINKTRYVNAETRQLVLEAMTRLEYDYARIRKRNAKAVGIIGVIVADIREDYFVALVKAIETVASENELSILLCDSEMDQAKEEKNIRTMLDRNVAGIIIAPIDSRRYSDKLSSCELPVILVDRQYDNHDRTFVGINNFDSGIAAFQHLEAKGCSRIGFVGYSEHVYSVRQRIHGYNAAATDSKTASEPKVLKVRYKNEDSYALIAQFVNNNHFDGLICATSDLCYEAIGAVTDSGLSIPEDIRLLTYDDNKWLDYLKYPVSVVTQPTVEIGAFAVEKMIELIGSPNNHSRIKTEVFFDIGIIDRQ